jgi:hypothetical protein
MRAPVVDDDDAFRTLIVALLADVADVVEQGADGKVATQLAHDYVPISSSGTETTNKLSEASAYGVVIGKNVTALRAELYAAAA